MIVSIFFLSNKSFAVTNSWVKEKGVWYYYDENGNKKTNGKYMIDDEYYFFDSNGEMRTKGWYNDGTEEYPRWFYITETGACKTGWLNLDGKWYYLQENYYDIGLMVANAGYNIDDKLYVFDQFGVMISKNGGGWQENYNDGEYCWYYLKGDIAQKGWQMIDGDWYYFDTYNGIMKDGPTMIYDDYKIWCFDSSGKWIENPKGWYKNVQHYHDFSDDDIEKIVNYDEWYYFEGQNGSTNKWINDNGKYYYVGEDGIMLENGLTGGILKMEKLKQDG